MKQQKEKCREIEDMNKVIISQSNRNLKEMRNANEAMKAENHKMKTRVLKLEEVQKRKECKVVQLREAVDVKSDEINKWKEMHMQSEYTLRLKIWLEEDKNKEDAQKIKKYVSQVHGSKDEERRCQSGYKSRKGAR